MIKGKVDDVLKQKLNEIEEKRYINIDILNEKRSNKSLKLVASITIIFLALAFGIIYITNKKSLLNKESIISKNVTYDDLTDNNVKDHENTANNTLNTIEMSNTSFGSIGSTQYILVVKIDNILSYNNFSKKINNNAYPITNLRATVLKDIKGNYGKDTVDFYTFGGNVRLSDYEQSLLPAEKEKLEIDKKSNEEKENTIISVIPNSAMGMPLPEINNTYIVSLTYDNTFYDSLGVVIGETYNFKLYDLNTNKYKNNFGNWVDTKF